jgi:hypothetical protein
MEEREKERRQRYDLNGNLILSKVGEGVFIVWGRKIRLKQVSCIQPV